jgi:threonyl-tRNA synthetase
MLIEHYAGAFPAWLAPVQAVVMGITDAQAPGVLRVQEALKAKGFRVIADLRNEKIGFKIRDRTLQRIPYLLVIGEREMESGTVSVRTRKGEDLGSLSLDDFTARLAADIAQRGRFVLEKRNSDQT